MKSLAGNKVLIALLAVMAIVMVLQTSYLVRVHGQLDGAGDREEVQRGLSPSPSEAGRADVAALTPHDPFAELEEAESRMRSLFDDFYARFDRGPGASWFDESPFLADGDSFFFGPNGRLGPRVDLQDRGDHYEMLVDVPGADETDVSVRIENDTLTVEGTRDATRAESDDGAYVRRERHVGRFERRLPLPADADPTTLHTEYENGVLRVTLAKQKSTDQRSDS